VFTPLRLFQNKDYLAACILGSVDGGLTYGRFELTARLDTTAERIRRNYETTVSQMRCPYHHKNAWVEVENEETDACHVDIVTCCQEFELRVRNLLVDPG
jgi:hypothetical protein